MTPSSRSPFSPLSLSQSQGFIDELKVLRAANPAADEFFRQFLELCQDYEQYAHSEMTDSQQYWLYRLGRLLALIGHDPFPNLTFTHPENTESVGPL